MINPRFSRGLISLIGDTAGHQNARGQGVGQAQPSTTIVLTIPLTHHSSWEGCAVENPGLAVKLSLSSWEKHVKMGIIPF